MKTRELIRLLETKPQDDEVDFVVVRRDGILVCMELHASALDMTQIMKLFGDRE